MVPPKRRELRKEDLLKEMFLLLEKCRRSLKLTHLLSRVQWGKVQAFSFFFPFKQAVDVLLFQNLLIQTSQHLNQLQERTTIVSCARANCSFYKVSKKKAVFRTLVLLPAVLKSPFSRQFLNCIFFLSWRKLQNFKLLLIQQL